VDVKEALEAVESGRVDGGRRFARLSAAIPTAAAAVPLLLLTGGSRPSLRLFVSLDISLVMSIVEIP
jgi:hypothetical protein